MSYPINYPTPQGANVQIFSEPNATASWVKPQGASFVWFTLIGSGGGGGPSDGIINGGGGGSAAVTNCLVPAFLIPDVLRVFVPRGGAGGAGIPGVSGAAATVVYQQKDGTGYTILSASGGDGGQGAVNGGTTGAGGLASTSNFFSAAGFFQSVSGSGNPSPSPTTFLSAGTSGASSQANYGWSGVFDGIFQMQPIIVSVGGSATTTGSGVGRVGGVGSGGGGGYQSGVTSGGPGGDGLVVIISW